MLARTFFKHPVRCGAVPPAAHEVVHDPKRGGLVWLVGAVPLAPAVAGRVCRWRKKMCSAVGAGVGGGGDNISSFVGKPRAQHPAGALQRRVIPVRGDGQQPPHERAATGASAPSQCTTVQVHRRDVGGGEVHGRADAREQHRALRRYGRRRGKAAPGRPPRTEPAQMASAAPLQTVKQSRTQRVALRWGEHGSGRAEPRAGGAARLRRGISRRA
eukprot:gene16824-biopygen23300